MTSIDAARLFGEDLARMAGQVDEGIDNLRFEAPGLLRPLNLVEFGSGRTVHPPIW